MRAVALAVLLLACSKPGGKREAGVEAKGAADAEARAEAKASAKEDAGAAARTPLNVLLISIDSLRADMPWAGYPRPIAPRLGALHARSVSYSRAYSTSSFTSKSIPGILTGRYP